MFKTLKKIIRCLSIVPLMCTSMFSHNQVTYDLNSGVVKSANINVDNGVRFCFSDYSCGSSDDGGLTWSYTKSNPFLNYSGTLPTIYYAPNGSFNSEVFATPDDKPLVYTNTSYAYTYMSTFFTTSLLPNTFYDVTVSFCSFYDDLSSGSITDDSGITLVTWVGLYVFILQYDDNNNIVYRFANTTLMSSASSNKDTNYELNFSCYDVNSFGLMIFVPYEFVHFYPRLNAVLKFLAIPMTHYNDSDASSLQSSVDELQSNYDTLNTEYASLLAKYNSLKAEYKLLSDKIDSWFSTYSSNGTNFYNPNQLNTISVEYRSKSESTSKIYTYSFNLSDSASIGLTDFQYDFNKIACLMLKNIIGDSSYSSYDASVDYINGSTYIFKKFTLNFKSGTIIDKNEYLWYETGDDRQYSGQMNVNNSSSWVDLVDNENHSNYGDYTSFRWSELVSTTKINSLTFAMSSDSANACSIYKFGVVTDAYQVGYDTAYNEINDQINDLNAKYEKLEDQYKAYREKYNNKSYQQGYNDGRSSVSDEGASITTLFTSIVGVPITILNGLGVLTVWDIPLISVLLSLMFAMLLLWLIKKLI